MITEQELREGLDRQVELEKKNAALNIKSKRGHALAHNDLYYMGKPCKRGHEGRRLVSDSSCYECSIEKRLRRKGVI
jgi:hypothetical protein